MSTSSTPIVQQDFPPAVQATSKVRINQAEERPAIASRGAAATQELGA